MLMHLTPAGEAGLQKLHGVMPASLLPAWPMLKVLTWAVMQTAATLAISCVWMRQDTGQHMPRNHRMRSMKRLEQAPKSMQAQRG